MPYPWDTGWGDTVHIFIKGKFALSFGDIIGRFFLNYTLNNLPINWAVNWNLGINKNHLLGIFKTILQLLHVIHWEIVYDIEIYSFYDYNYDRLGTMLTKSCFL